MFFLLGEKAMVEGRLGDGVSACVSRVDVKYKPFLLKENYKVP